MQYHLGSWFWYNQYIILRALHIYQSGVLSTFLLYLDYHWKWMTEKIISVHFAQGALLTVRTGGSTLAIDIGYAGEMVTQLENFSATETMSAGKMTSAIGQNSHVWTMKSLVSKIIKEVWITFTKTQNPEWTTKSRCK